MNLLFTNTGRRTYMIEFARKIIKSKIFVSDAERIVPSFYLNGVQKFITPKVEKNKKKYLESIISIIKNFYL